MSATSLNTVSMGWTPAARAPFSTWARAQNDSRPSAVRWAPMSAV